jgi:hypothetical protein
LAAIEFGDRAAFIERHVAPEIAAIAGRADSQSSIAGRTMW